MCFPPADPRIPTAQSFSSSAPRYCDCGAPEVTASALLDVVKRAAGGALTEARIFDVYHGEHIENNKKSIALGLTFQDSSRTLEDSDVQSVEAAVLEALAAGFGARLRGE